MSLAKKITKALAIGTLAIPGVSEAQDFYNGMRGPRDFMVDNYANVANGELSGTIIPKMFRGRLLLAAPFSVTDEGIDNKGLNIGLIADNILNNTHAIGAVGLFTDNEGAYRVLNPQVYTTIIKGQITVDVEANLPINLGTGETGGFGALTLGYGNDMNRIGGSVIARKGQKPEYQLLGRKDFKNHRFWMEGYLSKQRAGMRFVANF